MGSDAAEAGEGPDTEDDAADDLLIGDAADGRVAAVRRGGTVIPHDEVAPVRHLIGEVNITVTKGFVGNVGLADHFAVDKNSAVRFDVDPVSRAADDTLDEELVADVKANDISLFELGALERHDDLSVDDSGRHRGAVNLQDGQDEHGDERCHRGDHKQCADGAANDGMEALFAFCFLQDAFNGINVHTVWILLFREKVIFFFNHKSGIF